MKEVNGEKGEKEMGAHELRRNQPNSQAEMNVLQWAEE
jgi:hypothetical protein